MSRSSEGDAQGSSSISFQNKNENLHESISYGISVPSKKNRAKNGYQTTNFQAVTLGFPLR